jgi:Asp-tRNA(Asn)/Glu-tRNA(Gln) amidotransferase A subunit family amidase
MFHVLGVQTTACSRAYASFYGTDHSTATVIRRLIELGAVIVGKTRTAQFATGAEPNYWIDYQCPFNPRGDGYESTSGSSVGSAVAIAAYHWLDLAVASDSTFAFLGWTSQCLPCLAAIGSIPWPASAQGVYGLRPTFGSIERDGLLLLSQ